jgi:hypothetical protein
MAERLGRLADDGVRTLNAEIERTIPRIPSVNSTAVALARFVATTFKGSVPDVDFDALLADIAARSEFERLMFFCQLGGARLSEAHRAALIASVRRHTAEPIERDEGGMAELYRNLRANVWLVLSSVEPQPAVAREFWTRALEIAETMDGEDKLSIHVLAAISAAATSEDSKRLLEPMWHVTSKSRFMSVLRASVATVVLDGERLREAVIRICDHARLLTRAEFFQQMSPAIGTDAALLGVLLQGGRKYEGWLTRVGGVEILTEVFEAIRDVRRAWP